MSVTRADARPGSPAVPAPVSPLGRLGAWSYRHRRLVVIGWLAALAVFSLAGRMAGSQFKDNLNGGTPTQSQQAASFLQRAFPSQAGDVAQVVFETRAPVTSGAVRIRITRVLDGLTGLQHVASARSPFAPGAANQVSAGGHIAYGLVRFHGSGDAIPDSSIQRVIDAARGAATPGFTVQLGGAPVQKAEKPQFGKSEAIGILAAVLILLLAFGSVIAMVLPIVTAIAAVAITFGVLDLLSHGMTVPSFGPELAALVGLGVGIDYALFVVTRYRDALHAGAGPQSAVVTAMATSGRSVVFAGSTVVLSLLGLFLLGLPFIYGAALGAIIAVLLVLAASVTLLPAALGFAGTGIDRLRVRLPQRRRSEAGSQGFWWRWSRQVQRRPLLAAGAAIAALVALAVPLLSLRLAFTDAGTNPASYTSRQAYDLLSDGFGPGANGPLVIALELPGPAASPAGAPPAVASLRAQLAAQPDVAFVSPAQYSPTGTAGVITVIPRTSPQDARTSALVREIRDSVVPGAIAHSGVRVLVGGQTAASIDTAALISRRLGIVVAFVIVLSMLLLAAAFRSVVIPVISAVLTLLSTGAAYGVLVAVFQWGWLGTGIDNGATAPVDPWIPLMLFALLFGFSMDYQVFLISRIREQWRAGLPDSDAVARGLAETGRVITSAAAIMICVFAAFVLGDLRVLRVIGLGLAVAILLDATLVRVVATPAVLQLTGRANWWFPRVLRRAIPGFLAEIEPYPAGATSGHPVSNSAGKA